MKININIKIILGMILLFSIIGSNILGSILPLITAVECIGQGCNMNVSLNVTEIPVTPLPRFSILGQTIYSLLDSSGAGLGTFFQFLGQSIPILLLGIMAVALIVAIAYAIFKALTLWKETREPNI